MELSKSQFAEHIGVSPGRITQMIAAGIIGQDALVGEGRSARIDVETATRQIAERRHPGQALGNGLMTRLSGGGGEARVRGGDAGMPKGAAPEDGVPKSLAEQIQAERLEQERRKNRQAAIDEAVAAGKLIDGAAFRRELGRVGQKLVSEFTGMAPDIANAIAAEFELPQRDVLHLIRKVMAEKRRQAAARTRETAEALPETQTTEIETA